MSDSNNIQELTKLMVFSGRLSEVHTKNLEAFPFIFFNGVKKAKIEHNISTTKDIPSIISYEIDLDGENNFPEKRYEALHAAVKSIFWKEIQLKITINSKDVFVSDKSETQNA